MPSDAGDLANELSRDWRDLSVLLASRRLVASFGGGQGSRLTPTKVRALDLIAESGGLRISDLAAGMGVDETTGTRLVDRLERAGLATRERSADDRRATVVAVTTEGERLSAQVARRRQEFFRDVLDALDPDERTELVRLTAKATAALRARTEELVAP